MVELHVHVVSMQVYIKVTGSATLQHLPFNLHAHAYMYM